MNNNKNTQARAPKAPRPRETYSDKRRNDPMAELRATTMQVPQKKSAPKPAPEAKPTQVKPAQSAPVKTVPVQPKPAQPQRPVQPKQPAPTARPAQSAAPQRPAPVQPQMKPQQTISEQPRRESVYNNRHFEPERIVDPRMKRKAALNPAAAAEGRLNTNGNGIGTKIAKVCAMTLAYILTFAVILASTALISIKMICSDTSPAAKELFVTTLLETGQFKSLASLFLPADEVQKIVDDNTMELIEDEVDSSLITIDPAAGEEVGDQLDIEVKEISGSTFFGTLLIVKDPSRVSVSTIYPWRDQGVPIDELVEASGAIAGINGGLYNSYNNSGGRPYGVVVSNGEIQYNEPQQLTGFVLIGFTEDNILEIIPIDGYSKADVENLVAEKKIRDAVTFQEEASDKNNHFVQLVINGEAREMNGMGSGLNPRTAIGQRADGSILMLVTDGRGKEGHLGASASDLINIMVENGAINAANLDGGSSSCMYYDGEYLMDSVTFYQANTSWKLPLAFVVK